MKPFKTHHLKPISIFKKSVSDFWHNRNGAVAWITIVAAVPLILMMFYLVNSSKAIHEHTRTQDAADMIALVHAAEAARSLNTISMNQVSMTQAFASGVTSGSLIPIIGSTVALDAVGAAVSVAYGVKICKKYKNVPYVGAILVAACMVPSLLTAGRFGENAARALAIFVTHDPLNAHKVSSDAIRALNKKSEEILNRFPEAVSVAAKQIAQSAKVTDIYFDDSCKEPALASSCEASNKRQGMNLPVAKNLKNDGYYRFCAALHFGTGGFDLGSLGLPGLNVSLGASLMNGSYVKRGFPLLTGPMYGGDDDNKHLRDFVSKDTEMGDILTDFWRLVDNKSLYDGVLGGPLIALQAAAFAVEVADALGLPTEGLQDEMDDLLDQVLDAVGPIISAKAPGQVGAINYPYEQKEERNVYKDLVNVRTANMCAGDPAGSFMSAIGMDGVSEILGPLTGALPNIDVYHPKADGQGFSLIPSVPTIQPSIEDFSDHYKPLAFVYRKPNKRWAPKVFKDPNKGFYAYSEALVFNPDEIGLYSQNWQARLIPAKKMEDKISDIVSRMGTKSPNDFSDLKNDLQSIQGESSWGEVVAK